MFGWFNSQKRDIRNLNKDAASIVEMSSQSYRADRQREIALMTREGLLSVASKCAGDVNCIEREVERFQSLHREARSQNNQVALTGYTLMIIYQRALVIGEPCNQARAVIDDYLSQWNHAADDSDILPG